MEDLARLFEEKLPSNLEDQPNTQRKTEEVCQATRPKVDFSSPTNKYIPFLKSPAHGSLFPESNPWLRSPQGAGMVLDPPQAPCNSVRTIVEEDRPLKGHRSRRKMSRPQRSAHRWDPGFQGVTVKLRTTLSEDTSRLAISAMYNCDKVVLLSQQNASSTEVKTPRLTPPINKKGASFNFKTLSPLQQKYFAPSATSQAKQCASCGTKKTPLWRDAEDGTPLCNACGIRYKKYRMRCTHCWNIPKKDTKVNAHCVHCGHLLKFAFFKCKGW